LGTLTYPFTITHDTLADAAQVQSNFAAVAAVMNGNVQASTNAAVGTPSALTGTALASGSSSNLCRADHIHTVQCLEQLSADPSSGNFVRRMYANTATNKIRMCTATGGAGTWITVGNYAASDLPAHQGNHVPNGAGGDLLDGPAVQAVRTANQNITNSTWTTVNFNATDAYDTDTMHDTVTNNSRVTFTHAGLYRIWANVAFAAAAAGTMLSMIQLNSGGAVNSANVTLAGDSKSGASSLNTFMTPTATYKATAGDYMELFVQQNSGGTIAILGSASLLNASIGLAPCFFGAEWIGTGV